MATAIQKWKSADGAEWDSEEHADQRDRLCEAVRLAMLPLGDKPSLPACGFENGAGYVQHTAAVVEQVKLRVFEVAKEKLAWWLDSQKRDHGKTDYELAVVTHPSWHVRMLDGSCQPLESAYGRLSCIDKLNREWGQPFFALNPTEGKQVKLR